MSRVANKPIEIPKGVEINLTGNRVAVKGAKGSLEFHFHASVEVIKEGNELKFSGRGGTRESRMFAGTARATINNMVTGVSAGFQRKLLLEGVGFRAAAQGKNLNLTLGFSHPVIYSIPAGVKIETPSQTEIVISGLDKQVVGQVAAEIRAFRPPEPYKGKGVRFSDEKIVLKEAKKK